MRPSTVFALLAFGLLHAQAALSTEAETTGDATCMEVEVNGIRAPSYNCLSQKLRPSAPPRAAHGKAPLASETITQRPSNQLGLFNRAATDTRMGNTFGTSVYPQRPAARP